MTDFSSDSWKCPHFALPVHAVIEHQFRLGLRDVESTIIHGPKGVGKSRATQHIAERLRSKQFAEQLTGAAQSPEVLIYECSVAKGPKTVLVDLFTIMIKRPMGRRSKQDWTPRTYIEQIATRAVEDKVGLIVIDEAQMIDPSNLDLLRQVPDAARGLGHGLRLILIGNEALATNVAKIGEAGERFTGNVVFPMLTPEQVMPHLGGFHPGFIDIEKALPVKEWRALMRDFFGAVRGSFRRMHAIIANAHELAVRRGGSMTAEDLRHAIRKIGG